MLQEAVDSFVFWAPCKFVVEEHYCNSFAHVVAPCTGCLLVPVERSRGNLVAVGGGIAGVATAETAEVIATETVVAGNVGVVGPGTPLDGTVVDIG